MMDTMKLCVSCKACRHECPTGVDMAQMKIEVLAARAEKHGFSLRDRLVGYLPRYAPFAAGLRRSLNLRNRSPALRAADGNVRSASARGAICRRGGATGSPHARDRFGSGGRPRACSLGRQLQRCVRTGKSRGRDRDAGRAPATAFISPARRMDRRARYAAGSTFLSVGMSPRRARSSRERSTRCVPSWNAAFRSSDWSRAVCCRFATRRSLCCRGKIRGGPPRRRCCSRNLSRVRRRLDVLRRRSGRSARRLCYMAIVIKRRSAPWAPSRRRYA